ncbi:PHP domain-containing protein [Corticibacter populi]|uniref:PHP domain-containing protein n=1 Tax=Corticibacter populi TaxID=1550736 RepID=A0A3M6QNX5_9BURK|nr:PHP domain-containing protein [Corticibacter populi]RMX04746.1 PHP domain-containing protein [Corticibacter populi]RZS33850.1 hypothetical protein EV687_2177 [Corticibacter populi]
MAIDWSDHRLNADLHSHSTASDGTLTPGALAERARRNGVALWALTDHDTLDGQPAASSAAAALDLPYLTGVEISVTFLERTIHIVGLGFDAQDRALTEGLRHTRAGRSRRARQMAEALAEEGIAGAWEGALRFAGNPETLSRAHIARHLVAIGHCGSIQEVFQRYLTDGLPGFVPHQWAALPDAVGWITAAGGVAVLAHPARYDLNALQQQALIDAFKRHGGQGIEAITGSHRPHEYAKYTALASAEGLLASRGSDFHSPGESHVDLGQLPSLPASSLPVWACLAGRIQVPAR